MQKQNMALFSEILKQPGVIKLDILKNPVQICGKTTTIYACGHGKMYKAYINTNDIEAVGMGGMWTVYGFTNNRTTGYLVTGDRLNGYKHIYMHDLLMHPASGLVVDHKNHNGLDNRRKNLRVVTPHENMLNKQAYRNSKTGTAGLRVLSNGKHCVTLAREFRDENLAREALTKAANILNTYGLKDAHLWETMQIKDGVDA